MKRVAVIAGAAVALAGLLAAHVVYWYVPRERAAAPRLGPAGSGGTAGEPLRVLAAGAYDVCVWVPYPHQNLGALAEAIGDLQDVVGAAARLSSGEAGEASPPRPREPEEPPTFGPFEVPPASEMVGCSDLAGGRLRVVARIYPALAVVAKLAGRLAGNPWLAGGAAGAGSTRIAWEGRLWTVTAGQEAPLPRGGPAGTAAAPVAPPAVAPEAAVAAAPPELPESLAVVHWTGARPEIPPGYYALTRSGSDLALSLVESGGGGAGSAAALPGVAGPLPSLLVAVGPDWRGAERPPAALALFETGGSRLSTLGDLPGLAVFNAAAPGAAPGPVRWRLPTEGIFRLLAGRLPAADLAGWRILALDPGSLRQAEALAPRLAALVPPIPAGVTVPVGVGVPAGAGAGSSGTLPPGPTARSGVGAPGVLPLEPAGAAGAGNGVAVAGPAVAGPAAALSLGLWLEPRSTLRIVTRIRRFVEKFPLASRRQVDFWRDWETVLDSLAHCDHAVVAATALPPSMHLLLRGCTASGTR